MKKIALFAGICAILAACGGGNNPEREFSTDSASKPVVEESQNQVDTSTNNTKISSSSGEGKGKQLIAQSDCLTCHKEQEKLIGPAYLDVAKKYEDNDKNVNYLADKIINGGSGIWGEVQMTPHPAISKDDAKEMVHYILSLND